jgi:acetoacetate decarboxylase
MPDSTGFGDYTETGQVIPVRFKGEDGVYVHSMYLDDDAPIAGGRELWGFPKKLATISFGRERDMIYGAVERPVGFRLASVIVRPEQPMKAMAPSGPTCGLRIIPGVEGAARPACAEIIAAQTEHTIIAAWEGTGSIDFAQHSALDPLDRFPVRRILKATYMEYDILLPAGRVIARL